LPALACQAVGGDETVTLPAVAAMACLQVSIILADDMLDQDPRGQHHRMGGGRAANLALAFQAAAFALIGRAPLAADRRAAALAALAQAALVTAAGQELDVRNLTGEENYWRVVRAKSTPFYGLALQLGALAAGADAAVVQGLFDLGIVFGEIIQLYDDLVDAFETPANPDWGEGRNNLAILYAGTADHPQRDRFLRLRPAAADPQILEDAQRILIECGAVSFCAYQIVRRQRAGRERLERLALADPAPLREMLDRQAQPLAAWLAGLGVSLPSALFGEPA
jgi:geranylgeranyl pyrophosphate synthase